jgi:hypothetical protein
MAEIARHYTLVTLDGVRSLFKRRVLFKCRYEFVGFAPDGMAKYTCIYVHENEEAILVLSKLGEKGPAAREFKLWPGLFNHHSEFGDGSVICVHHDWKITCLKENQVT